MLKTLIRWNLLEKREPYRYAFLYEKAIKTDIYAVRSVAELQQGNAPPKI
jgi:hypothetical protein